VQISHLRFCHCSLNFYEGAGVAVVRVVESLKAIVASSNGMMWGVWTESNFTKVTKKALSIDALV
jgi:hypothetical protein